MDETRATGEESTSSQESESSAKVSGQELMEELGRLGARFVTLAEAAWASNERKQLEADLRKGLNSVVESLEEGFQRIRESEQTKESVAKAKDVAEHFTERVSTSQTAHELADGLMQGLRTLGERLDKLANEFSKEKANEDVAAAKEQDIPVENLSKDREG